MGPDVFIRIQYDGVFHFILEVLCSVPFKFGSSLLYSFLSSESKHTRPGVENGDMTDPTQQCPDSWQKITSPKSSCGKKSTAPCDSLNIATSGAFYQTVCGSYG